MTTASGPSAQIEAYLAAVRSSLSDLAEDERADLLAEVEASLVEAAGEGDRPINSLGPPEEFAAELRASAGFGESAAPVAEPRRPLEALRAFAAELVQRPAVRSGLRAARELAPAWWLVRGYLVVAAIALVTGATWSIAHPWLPRLATWHLGAAALVAGVVASLALGMRHASARIRLRGARARGQHRRAARDHPCRAARDAGLGVRDRRRAAGFVATRAGPGPRVRR